jgi:hypothetical protein
MSRGRRRGLEPIGDEVGRELRRFPPVAGMAAIVSAWPVTVGDGISRNAWPARLSRDGTVHVATSSSAWAFELTQLEPDIRRRVGDAVRGEVVISKLRFAPGPLPEPAAELQPEEHRGTRAPDAASVAEAERLSAGIGDEELRKMVARAAAASLSRAANSRLV